jgi:hypothetical protein
MDKGRHAPPRLQSLQKWHLRDVQFVARRSGRQRFKHHRRDAWPAILTSGNFLEVTAQCRRGFSFVGGQGNLLIYQLTRSNVVTENLATPNPSDSVVAAIHYLHNNCGSFLD